MNLTRRSEKNQLSLNNPCLLLCVKTEAYKLWCAKCCNKHLYHFVNSIFKMSLLLVKTSHADQETASFLFHLKYLLFNFNFLKLHSLVNTPSTTSDGLKSPIYLFRKGSTLRHHPLPCAPSKSIKSTAL